MRTCINGIILILYSFITFAQKAPIDSNALKKWTYVSGPKISNNGYYVLYTIENQPLGKRTMVFLNTKNNWKLEVPESSGLFTSDSKYVIFKKEKDSLGIIKTDNGNVSYIPFVQSFTISRNGNAKWVIYQLNNSQKTVVIYNLETGNEKNFDFVKQYLLSEDCSTLVFLTEEKKDTVIQNLHWLSLASGDLKTIWQGANAGNFVLNKSNKQIAFTVERSSFNEAKKTIWFYKNGMDKAIELATNLSIENESTFELDKIGHFSDDDSCLYITIKQKDSPKPKPSPVDVWSYTDTILQSKQLNGIYSEIYQAALRLQNAHLIRLTRDNEMLILPSFNEGTNSWGIIISRPGDSGEEEWNVKASKSGFLVSMGDGRRKNIPGLGDIRAKISPKERYVIYYDPKQKNFFSYEIESGTIRNITKDIQTKWVRNNADLPISNNFPRGIAGWLKNDEAVLIYDEHDIWQIDMAGQKMPINITNGYGKKHNIVFSMGLRHYDFKTLSNHERLILNAFNLGTKDNGFFSKTLLKSGDPELLSMGPYLYNIPNSPGIPGGSNFIPVKAEQTEVYLVRRMSANEAPNFFSTSDFKKFIPLSDIHPEKKYNWLKSELVNWKGLDGRPLQGILYKPENFDPQKKYPVIFNYYERKSDGLHAFLRPDYSSDDINIPWYISNDYLVFQPDIHYRIGETGESAINSVVSAAQYLSKESWVNSKKMGIHGFSFGGYETNFLVTHSKIFAAACSASGLSNLVSAYGGLYDTGGSMQSIIEFGQVRIGATLWERPDLYIKNSPVFAADQVTTPLLMMHTKQDGACPFSNAIEFFTALRRLNKKVWMLQYEGNHFPTGKGVVDFSTRLAQFFDHYLKGAPAPKWMIQGIPAKLRGIETGLEVTQ